MMILSKEGTPLSRYMEHGTSDPLQQLYQAMPSGKKRVTSLPVCPKCEKVGFRTHGWALNRTMACPHCGYQGHATHQLAAYIEDKLYK